MAMRKLVAVRVHLELQLAELAGRRVLDRVLERLLQDDSGALRQVLLAIGGSQKKRQNSRTPSM
jgi:hypothetical protein